jgi:hypothetical protein
MNLTPEQFTIIMAIGFTLARLLEFVITKGFYLVTGKNGEPAELRELRKISGNHLSHILEEMKKQTEQHNKMNDSLIEIVTVLRERK